MAPERSTRRHGEGHVCLFAMHHRHTCTSLCSLLLFLLVIRKEASEDLRPGCEKGDAAHWRPRLGLGVRSRTQGSVGCTRVATCICSSGVDVHQTQSAFRGRAPHTVSRPSSRGGASPRCPHRPQVLTACSCPAGDQAEAGSKPKGTVVVQPQQHLLSII